MGFAGRVVKKHKKIAKGALKVHKKAAKLGYKGAKMAGEGPTNLVGKLIGGKVGKVVSKVGKYANPITGPINAVKKIFKKKNTNVGKAGKEKRRTRIDAREKEGRTTKQQAVVDARRAKVDAKDTKRFSKNETAKNRINKKIKKMNERKGTNYKTY